MCSSNEEALVSVPRLISCFECGQGIPFFDGEEKFELPKVFVQGLKKPFLVEVAGFSMYPTFHPTDILLADAGVTFKSGDIVVCALNGVFLIKKLVISKNGSMLVSLNPCYPEIHVNLQDSFYVLGVVKKVMKGIEDKKFWLKNLPFNN